MSQFTSLRSRLIVVYVGLMVLGFGSLTVWSARQVYTSTFADYGNTLHVYTLLLASRLEEPLEYSQLREASSVIASAADDLDGQVSVFASNGEFLISSDLEPTTLVSSDASHEVVDGQVIATTDILHDDEVMGIVQISTSTAIPFANVLQRWYALAAGLVLFSVLSLAITLRLINAMTRPLDSLRVNALRIAEGDLSRRMTDLPNDEIGAVGRAFNTMIERVLALLNEQRAFASNASHELRTPLTTIRLRTEALQGEIEPELETQYVKEIDSEVARLGKLVDDLLLLSRLDAKRMEVGKEQIDCVRMVETLERQYGRVADQKEIALEVLKPAESLLVVASLTHLQIVFRNVIDNALKYTPGRGEVRVQLDADEQFAVLTVKDSGRGIAPDNLPNIGKRFYRTDKSRNRSTAGTGLGLSLVASILELYSGTINIHSDGVDLGTVVTVRWPLTAG